MGVRFAVVFWSCLAVASAAEPAEGFGAETPGGRGGKHLVVTTLADSGPGSLREAVSVKGPRTITFQVAGEIHLERTLAIVEPYVTIDASTAPAPGVTLRDDSVFIRTHDVIIRHLRSRPGDTGKGKLADVHAFSLAYASNVLLDHCSAYWGIDENIGMYQVHDITVQWCILAEGLFHSKHDKGPHSMGALIGGNATGRVSLHHCLFASNNQRNPRLQSGVVDVRNNVFYNWGAAAGNFTGRTQVNFVGNLYLPGPDSNKKKPLALSPEVELYLEDSALLDGAKRLVDWDLVQVAKDAAPRRSDKPFPAPKVTTLPSDAAYEEVLAKAGATSPARDAVDERVVAGVRQRTGRIIDTPSQADAALRVSGDELAWKIETRQFVVNLAKNPGTGRNGQINSIFVKDRGLLLTRNRPTSTLHLSPNASADKHWAGINRWDPPARHSASTTPRSFRLEREGEMPNIPGLWVKTAYEIFADAPTILVEESVEARSDVEVGLLRLAEWSFAPGAENPFSHLAWEDAEGRVSIRKKEKEEVLPLETRWQAFFSESRRVGFAAVVERFETNERALLKNVSARFAGDPHYFYRTLAYSEKGPLVKIPRGARYSLRYRVFCFTPAEGARAAEPVSALYRSLR